MVPRYLRPSQHTAHPGSSSAGARRQPASWATPTQGARAKCSSGAHTPCLSALLANLARSDRVQNCSLAWIALPVRCRSLIWACANQEGSPLNRYCPARFLSAATKARVNISKHTRVSLSWQMHTQNTCTHTHIHTNIHTHTRTHTHTHTHARTRARTHTCMCTGRANVHSRFGEQEEGGVQSVHVAILRVSRDSAGCKHGQTQEGGMVGQRSNKCALLRLQPCQAKGMF